MESFATIVKCFQPLNIVVITYILDVFWDPGYASDFGISVVILLRGANSVQTSVRCRDLAGDVDSPPLKKCRGWTMKLEIRYLFPTLPLGRKFLYLISCLKVWEREKYQHMVLECKRIHKTGSTFSPFSRIFIELCGSKVPLAPLHGDFIIGVANPPKSSISFHTVSSIGAINSRQVIIQSFHLKP